jgi:hypothetical protein
LKIYHEKEGFICNIIIGHKFINLEFVEKTLNKCL